MLVRIVTIVPGGPLRCLRSGANPPGKEPSRARPVSQTRSENPDRRSDRRDGGETGERPGPPGHRSPTGDRGLPRVDRPSPPPPGATGRLRGLPIDGAAASARDRAGMPNGTEACHRSEGGTAPRPWVRTPAIASEDEIASPPGSCHRPTDIAPAPGEVGLRKIGDVGPSPSIPNPDHGGRTMSDTHAPPLRAFEG